MAKELIWGVNPVRELIRAGKRRVYQIYDQKERVKNYRDFISTPNIKLTITNKHTLFNIVKRTDHQGIVAKTDSYPYADDSEILSIEKGLLLALDGITDPQNMGAIIRSAYLCGVSAIIIPSRGSSAITPVVTHTSAGATEYIPIMRTDSFLHILQQLKTRDFYLIGAETAERGGYDIRKVNFPKAVTIVMGSEGYGLHNRVAKACDRLAALPQKGTLDSFNVSVAAGIILFTAASEMGIIE